MSRPAVTLTSIDPVLTIPDVCRVLKLSESQFHELTPRLRAMGLLQPVVPSLDRRTRYLGAPLADFLSDKRQQREMAKLLEEAS